MKKTLVLLSILALSAGCRKNEQATPAGSAQSPPAVETASRATGTEVGSVMPEYSSTSLDGTRFALEDRRDRVVLLNLWATWCGPCRYEIPELQALHDRYAPRGFEVLGVSLDESGPEAVREFVDEFKITYPISLDPDGQIANIMQTSVLPTSVIIDRQGVIVWKKFGAVMPDDQELIQAIEKSL
jgi:cytochrome c biogenesis protein CcmG, thiol:disulfide interchange protein DsbE